MMTYCFSATIWHYGQVRNLQVGGGGAATALHAVMTLYAAMALHAGMDLHSAMVFYAEMALYAAMVLPAVAAVVIVFVESGQL